MGRIPLEAAVPVPPLPPLVARPSSRFAKDLKRARKQGLDLAELYAVVALLQVRAPLPERCRDHALLGSWIGFRECHIRPDWLLVYAVNDTALVLVLQRTGTHADLFGE